MKVGSVTAILERKNGELWIIGGSTVSRMIDFSEEEGTTFVSLEKDGKDSTTIQTSSLEIVEDKKGTIWINTFQDFTK